MSSAGVDIALSMRVRLAKHVAKSFKSAPFDGLAWTKVARRLQETAQHRLL